MKRLKIIFVCILATFSISLTAQKQQFKKADSHYKAKNYSQAIPLYKEGLSLRPKLSAKTKLANCYRKINQMEKAELLYAQIVKKRKAKTLTYLHYAETLMSNEKYDEAKYWFEQYHKFHPEKEKGRLMAEACDKVKDIQAYFPDAAIYPFSQNSDGDDTAPVFFNGGIVYSSDRKMGAKLLKQKSGTTGRDFINIYFSEEQENAQFKKPKKFSGKLNELNKNTANFSYRADSTLAVFSRNSNVTNRKNAFTMQLFQAESSNGKKWKNVEPISFCRVAYNYMHPALSPDGKLLFFVSDKPSGNGGTDLYVSKRKKEGDWGKPKNLGNIINTSNNEGFPYFHKDGKLYFCSKGHTSYGGFDIFFSQYNPETEEWSTPVNVGKPINSSSDDISIFIDQEDHRGLFTSSREGGDDDIYLFWLNGLPDSLSALQEEETLAETTAVTQDSSLLLTSATNPLIEETESSSISATDLEAEQKDSPPIEVPLDYSTMPTDSSLSIDSLKEQKVNSSLEESTIVQETLVDTSIVVESHAVDSLVNHSNPVVTPSVNGELEPLPIPSTDSLQIQSIKKEEKEQESNSSRIHDGAFQSSSTSQMISTESLLVRKKIGPKMVTDRLPTSPQVIGALAIVAKKDHQVIEARSQSAIQFSRLKKDIRKKQINTQHHYRFKDVAFELGSYLLESTSEKELVDLIQLLNKHPKLTIEISCYTISIGSDKSNRALSQNRATAISRFLIKKGIDSERIEAIGYGEQFLLNHCGEGVVCTQEEHRINERVELSVFGH